MSKKLDDIAKRVSEEQSALEGNTETTRDRVLRMGTELREAQVQQKQEQKEQAEQGLEVQTWKHWCEAELALMVKWSSGAISDCMDVEKMPRRMGRDAAKIQGLTEEGKKLLAIKRPALTTAEAEDWMDIAMERLHNLADDCVTIAAKDDE